MNCKQERISSDLTLFFKFFVPVFWTVFTGAMTIAYWLTPLGIGYKSLRLVYTFILVSGIILIFFTVFRLKRVEIHPDYIFITNYFKYYRYPLIDLDRISFRNFLFFKIGKVVLKERGSLGKELYFLASKSRFKSFKEAYSKQINILDSAT